MGTPRDPRHASDSPFIVGARLSAAKHRQAALALLKDARETLSSLCEAEAGQLIERINVFTGE
jgi:hypothetical protein